MILAAIPLLSVVAAVLSAAVPKPGWARIVTLVGALATFSLTSAVAWRIDQVGTLVLQANWVGVNALAALILLLQGFVALTAAIYSWGYIPKIADGDFAREQRYYRNLNLFIASLFLVPMLLQPALTWVAVELTTILSIFLVAFDNTRQALEAAWKYAVITIMGATVAAFGIFLLLFGLAGHPAEAQTWAALAAQAPHMSPDAVKLAFVLILVGLGTKVGLVPLHTWLPDAHSQAPTPVCALLSGVEVTTILYVIMRLWPVFLQVPGFSAATWALVFGLVSVGTAAFLLLQVHDFKRLFAFSTVEHMGILLVALGLGPVGGYGLTYQLLTHGLTKSVAFYAAGMVLLITGTREIEAVKGLMRTSPWAAIVLMGSGLAIAGAPPFAVFLSEFAIFRSALATGHGWVLAVLLLFLTIAFLGIMGHINRMVFGTPSHRPTPLPRTTTVALLVGAIPVILLGVYVPAPIQHLFVLAAATLRR